jgi:DNA-binding MarR family transcriptional regulator
MTDEPEYGVLMALETGPLTRDELVERTSLTDREVNQLLFKLITETYVYESVQDGRGKVYRLTPLGIGKVTMIHEMLTSGEASFGQFIGAMTEAHRRTKESIKRDEMQPILLSEPDRTAAATALAEQFALRRIDAGELNRRSELLHAARIHADLGPVFEGLPDPQLYREQAQQRTVWRWVVFGLAVGVSMPFLAFGILLLANASQSDNLAVGLVMVGGALAWSFFAWYWASGRKAARARR